MLFWVGGSGDLPPEPLTLGSAPRIQELALRQPLRSETLQEEQPQGREVYHQVTAARIPLINITESANVMIRSDPRGSAAPATASRCVLNSASCPCNL